MSKLKLTYFDFPGSRGEEIRLALTLAGQPFEDNRIDGPTFAALKPDLPFSTLPVFKVEGRIVIGQSNAALRLIGRQHDLYPDDLFEAARHDTLMDAAEDLRYKISPTMRIKDAVEKREARQQLAESYIPQWARGVENLLGEGPFVSGAKPAVADIKLYMVHRWISSAALDDIPSDIFDAYPKLNAVAVAVKTLPAVEAWYAADH